jgi:hypothetical protein
MRTGLTALDKEHVCPGYILYTPLFSPGTAYLIDREGREVHRWDLPYPPGMYGYLLPNGNLFYMGKVRDETWDRFPMWRWIKGGVLLEVDWTGRIVWEHVDPNHHHDARRTAAGGAIYLTIERVPADIATNVRGGLPGSDRDGMWADGIVEVDAAGRRIWEWHALEHLDPETDRLPANASRREWSHANSIVPLPDERVLVSFRNISTLAIIDKRTGGFVWKLGPGVLAQQHDPNLLPNGHILVFDNGIYRPQAELPFSRVIEIDPQTNDIVWQYRDNPPYNFFSPLMSGTCRLPNGNTLITEGAFGRLFEITPAGEVVWEYINPHFPPALDGLPDNSVFRASHYLADEILVELPDQVD